MFHLILLKSILKTRKQSRLFATLTALYPTVKTVGFYGFFFKPELEMSVEKAFALLDAIAG